MEVFFVNTFEFSSPQTYKYPRSSLFTHEAISSLIFSISNSQSLRNNTSRLSRFKTLNFLKSYDFLSNKLQLSSQIKTLNFLKSYGFLSNRLQLSSQVIFLLACKIEVPNDFFNYFNCIN